jgi:uracil-DNA glycosylase family 4
MSGSSPAQKLAYLQTMGVDVWVRRVVPADEVERAVAAVSLAAGEGGVPQDATAQVSAQAAPAHGATPRLAEEAQLSPSTESPVSLESPRRRRSEANPSALGPEPGFMSQPAARSGATSTSPGGTGSSPVRTISVPLTALKPATRIPVPADVDAQWDALKAEVLSCTKCALHTTRTQGVFGVGNRKADWLIIGEAPGAEEDRRGEPFVGRAGQLLNAMLKAIGLSREQVFIANVLKSRPPSNRDPKPDEVAACIPYLMRQIALLQPRLILAVGRIAAQNLLQTDMALGRLRSQVHTFGELNTPLIVTYHPAYLLRTPADKRKAWDDLKFARSTFQRLASQEP